MPGQTNNSLAADDLTPTMVSSGASSSNSTPISSTMATSTSLEGQTVDTALSNAIAKAVNNSLLSLLLGILGALHERRVQRFHLLSILPFLVSRPSPHLHGVIGTDLLHFCWPVIRSRYCGSFVCFHFFNPSQPGVQFPAILTISRWNLVQRVGRYQ